MRVLVCGSRYWNNWLMLKERLDRLPETAYIIEGGAKGADLMAREYAIGRGLAYREIRADWAIHGKAAGPIRNRLMLDLNPELVIAFHENISESKGTLDTVTEAKRRGIPVEVFGTIKPETSTS